MAASASPGPDAVFSALAHPVRRSVLEAISRGEHPTVAALSAGLPISRQAVSKHLAALRDARLVRSRRQGRETVYELQPGPLTDAARWMDEVGGEWDRRLGALRRSLEKRQ
jgi:DNA-binding transcriptional ArsR family regulator